MHQVPHLNTLHERLFQKGLVVVGVTGEDKTEVETFIGKHKVTYPIGIGWSDGYDVKGIPAAFLIDPSGKVAWRGHPGQLEDKTIDAALVGARPATVAPGLEEVNRLRQEGKHGPAHQKARELLAGGTLSAEAQTQGEEIALEIEQAVATALEGATKAEANADVYLAWSLLDPIVNAYAGVPRQDEAAALLAKITGDNRNKREIEAGKRLAAARALEAARDFEGAYKAYKAMGSFSTTKAGKDAAAAWRAIEKDGKLGYKRGCGACEAIGRACPAHKKKA
jgi:hypothetical protein